MFFEKWDVFKFFIVNCEMGEMQDKYFYFIIDMLEFGDVFVMNDI